MKTIHAIYLALILIGWITPITPYAANNNISDIKPSPRTISINSIADSLNIDKESELKLSASSMHSFQLSTQPLIWGAGIMNLETDIKLNNKTSMSMGIGYAPWFISSKFAPRCLFIFPEGRWWFSSFGEGAFIGLHFNVAWYNLRMGNYRYQDPDFPALGGGMTLGYQLLLAPNFSLRLDIGAGYTHLKYDRYKNIVNGSKIDTRITNYFGIDRFSIAFSYMLPF